MHIDWIINWLNIFGATIFQNIRKPIEARRGQKGKYQLEYRRAVCIELNVLQVKVLTETI